MDFSQLRNSLSSSYIKSYISGAGIFKINTIRIDVLLCGIIYRCSPDNYFYYGFFNKTAKERASVLTDSQRSMILSRFDDSEIGKEDKWLNYCLAKSYYKRDAILLSHDTINLVDVASFLASHPTYFAKQYPSSCGNGVVKITNANAEMGGENLLDFYPCWILEEPIIQSNQMSCWCASCVNTIRINSFLHNGRVRTLGNFFRTGREGSIVDNGGQGGVFASIDEKGVVITEAYNRFGHKFAVHPDSGKIFIGYEIPQWEELIHLVEEAHTTCFPSTKFISWDFALTDVGWVVVELGWGQMSAQVSLQKGLKREFLQLLLGE